MEWCGDNSVRHEHGAYVNNNTANSKETREQWARFPYALSENAVTAALFDPGVYLKRSVLRASLPQYRATHKIRICADKGHILQLSHPFTKCCVDVSIALITTVATITAAATTNTFPENLIDIVYFTTSPRDK